MGLGIRGVARSVLGSRRAVVAGVTLGAALLAIGVRASGALRSVELSSVDTRFRIRGSQRPDAGIVIVGFDSRTLSTLNLSSQAIPRTLQARLIDDLHRDRPRLIGDDIQFDGAKTPAGDAALKQAISAARPVLLATHDTAAGIPVPVPAGDTDPGALGAVLGSVGAPQDADGEIRQMLYAPVTTVNFDVRAAELITGHPVSQSHFPENAAWIDYAGPPRTFRTYSVSDVLAGRIPAAAFRGRTVLIGETDPVFFDVDQTPFSDTPMAGVEIHANALATILHGFPLQPTAGWFDDLLIVLLVALPGMLALRVGALYVLGGSLAGLGLLLTGAQLAFDGGWIVSLVPSALGLVVSAAGSATVDALMVRRQLRTLSEAVEQLARGIGPGEVIGDYRIEELVGRGGMGVVYRATQTSLQREVALKVIVPELADDAEFRARFQRESLLAAAVEHENVVPVFEAGESGSLLFLAMRFIDGVDLGELLRSRGALDPLQAGRITEQVAAALGAAHARGLIHRDVKPTNILIDLVGDEHVYLTDFGLARRADSETALTRTGAIAGTIDYLAPEQVSGDELGPGVDIYALGCVLYQALTGEVPFPRDTDVAKLFAHVSADVPSASAVRPGLGDAVDGVIRRALAKRPEDRYPSALAFAEAVRTTLAPQVNGDAAA